MSRPPAGWDRSSQKDLVRLALTEDSLFEPVLAILRGNVVERIHRGAIALVDSEGRLLDCVGDHRVEVDPWPALSLLLPPAEFAALCGLRTHEGEPEIRLALSEVARLFALIAGGATSGLERTRDMFLQHGRLVAGCSGVIEAGRTDDRVIVSARVGSLQARGVSRGAMDDQPGRALGCAVKIEDGSPAPLFYLTSLYLATPSPDLDSWSGMPAADGATLVPLVSPRVSVTRPTGRRVVTLRVDQATRIPRWRRGLPTKSGPSSSQTTIVSCRSDDRELVQVLREEWPVADEETFGHRLDWVAEPIAFILRRERRALGALKGHFIGGVACLDELVIRRGERGRGNGSLLLARFEKEAADRGCTRVVLRAVKDGSAEAFYRRHGYYRECVQSGYEFGYDYVRLTRPLGVSVRPAVGRSPEMSEEKPR